MGRIRIKRDINIPPFLGLSNTQISEHILGDIKWDPFSLGRGQICDIVGKLI
jgi:hypothetical protein